MLLGVQLAGVLLYPFMEGAGAGRALFSLFGIVVLGLAVLAVRASPAFTWFSVMLGAPAAALLVVVGSPTTRRCCPTPARSKRSSTSTPPTR